VENRNASDAKAKAPAFPLIFIAVALFLFVAAASTWLLAETALAQLATREVPHPLEELSNCLLCHNIGSTNPFTADHALRTNATCALCHRPGAATTPPPPPGSRSLEEEQAFCMSCHGNQSLTKTTPEGDQISFYVDVVRKQSSAHRFIRCNTCHSSDPHAEQTPLNKLSLAQKCGTCHEYEYQLHLQSVHGQQLAMGNPDVATCVDCHSTDKTPHSVIRVLEYTAPAYRKNIAQTCGECHGSEELMARYGIVEQVYETYMRSFHGKAMQLGTYEMSQLDKATCTNCHGTHDIRRVDDPSSPAAGIENLAKTCEQCHPGAGVKFASTFLGHKEASPQVSPGVFYTERFFTVFTSSVVGLGIFLMAIASIRWGIRRWRE